MKTLHLYKKGLSMLVLFISILLVVGSTILMNGRHYYLAAIMLLLLSWVWVYFRYEQKKPSLRKIVVLAVMISLVVSSRAIFIFTPGFKPMTAMIIICGIVFGKEEGYICGSLAAFISNFIFGQGPWTPFQMFAWGMIGYGAGFLKREQTFWIYSYALCSGVFYTLCMDLWSVLLFDTFQWQRYIIYVIGSLPTTIMYCIANVTFIFLLKDTCFQKCNRIKKKYGWE